MNVKIHLVHSHINFPKIWEKLKKNKVNIFTTISKNGIPMSRARLVAGYGYLSEIQQLKTFVRMKQNLLNAYYLPSKQEEYKFHSVFIC